MSMGDVLEVGGAAGFHLLRLPRAAEVDDTAKLAHENGLGGVGRFRRAYIGSSWQILQLVLIIASVSRVRHDRGRR
jgi:hypothetical protein